jgi:hypothetical protein
MRIVQEAILNKQSIDFKIQKSLTTILEFYLKILNVRFNIIIKK